MRYIYQFVASWCSCLHAALTFATLFLQYCVCRSYSVHKYNKLPQLTPIIYMYIYYIGAQTHKETEK